MKDYIINALNRYFFSKNLRKFAIWYTLEINTKIIRYSPDSFNRLIDDIRNYYKSLDLNEIYYQKKILEIKINNFSKGASISQYLANLLAAVAIFIAGIIALYSKIGSSSEIFWMFRSIAIFAAVLVFISFIVYLIDILVNSNLKKSFNLLCLEILDEVEKKKTKRNKRRNFCGSIKHNIIKKGL
jgi:hypothetical protein